MLYNVVLFYAVQWSESDIHIHISPLFWISFPFRSPQSTEFPERSSRFSSVIYFIHSVSSVSMGQILLHPLGSYSNRGTRGVVVKQQIQPPSLEAYCLDGRQMINRNPKRAAHYRGEGQVTPGKIAGRH